MERDLAPLIATWYKDWFRNERLYDVWARQHGLNYSSLFTLYVLNSTGGCTPSYIAVFLSISKQTVNSMLGRLEKKLLIKRVPSSTDGRSCMVLLSDNGVRWVSDLMQALTTMEYHAFGRLTENEVRQMIELDGKLTDSISEEMQEEAKK